MTKRRPSNSLITRIAKCLVRRAYVNEGQISVELIRSRRSLFTEAARKDTFTLLYTKRDIRAHFGLNPALIVLRCSARDCVLWMGLFVWMRCAKVAGNMCRWGLTDSNFRDNRCGGFHLYEFIAVAGIRGQWQ